MHFGGPVELGRGFVLHSPDYVGDTTLVVSHHAALTSSVDVLRALGAGKGPRHGFIAFGYAGWAPGQLEAEIAEDAWVIVPADEKLIFGHDNDGKWDRAISKRRYRSLVGGHRPPSRGVMWGVRRAGPVSQVWRSMPPTLMPS